MEAIHWLMHVSLAGIAGILALRLRAARRRGHREQVLPIKRELDEVMAIAKVFSPICYMNDETWDAAEAVLREHVARPPTEPKGFPDGEPYGVILDYLAWCANGWMGDARLVGNLRAGDIVRAVAEAQQEIARLRKERDSLVSVIENLWQHAEPSIRAEDIREQIACVLSTAGNVPRSEKPT